MGCWQKGALLGCRQKEGLGCQQKQGMGCQQKEALGCQHKGGLGCRQKEALGCQQKEALGCQQKEAWAASKRRPWAASRRRLWLPAEGGTYPSTIVVKPQGKYFVFILFNDYSCLIIYLLICRHVDEFRLFNNCCKTTRQLFCFHFI